VAAIRGLRSPPATLPPANARRPFRLAVVTAFSLKLASPLDRRGLRVLRVLRRLRELRVLRGLRGLRKIRGAAGPFGGVGDFA
ncbi:MAG: hypothetical protein ACI30W_08505, partial [Muribaculaceae bacterium]